MSEQELRDLAADLIDDVEHAIRNEHKFIDDFAENRVVDDDNKPNTLLYGDSYYTLEDEVIEKLRQLQVKPSCP